MVSTKKWPILIRFLNQNLPKPGPSDENDDLSFSSKKIQELHLQY